MGRRQRALPSGVVTFVFTDIEGASAMHERLGDAYKQLLHRHRTVVRAALDEHGGAEVKAVGDGFFLAFDDPGQAVAFCLRAQDGLQAAGWPDGAEVRVRMGLHAGDAVPEADDYISSAVDIAARLCAAAHGGQVLASEEVVRRAGDHSQVDLGRYRLRGSAQARRLFELRAGGRAGPRARTPRAAHATPVSDLLKPASPSASTTDLLEREHELGVLRDLVGALAERREGEVVLLQGAAGIGKSRLLAAARDYADDAGALVMAAHGTELEFELAFGGVRQLFTSTLFGLDPAERADAFSGPAGFAGPVLGFAGDAPSHAGLGDPLHGLFWLTANLTRQRPVLVAVDDLHWLDPESARFIAYLGRRLAGLPVLLLAAVRPDEPGAGGAAAAELMAAATVLRPGPLSADAVNALTSAEDAHRLTGGNPFLAVELERSRASGATGGASVARSVLGRAARVSEEAVLLAKAVALFPDGATLDEAVVVCDLSLDVAIEAADGLVRAQVLTDSDRLAFLHPLMRSAVYEEIGPFGRRRGHRRVAEALKEHGAAPEEIAAHLLAGEPGGDEANIAILEQAAAAARRSSAPRAAARYLERALAEPPASADKRSALGLELGRLQAMTGQPEAEATLRQALRESADARRTATLLFELSAVSYENLRPVEAFADLSSFGDVEAGPDDALALDALRLLVGREVTGGGRMAEAAAARIPRDLPGDTPHERLALLALAQDGSDRGTLTAGQLGDLLLRVIDRGTQLVPAAGALVGVSFLLVSAGLVDLAQELGEERALHARETGDEAQFAIAQLEIANAVMMRGEFRSAEAFARLALESPGASYGVRSWAVENLTQVMLYQGRFDEAESLWRAHPAQASPGTDFEQQIATIAAVIEAGRGHFARAVPALERRNAAVRELRSNPWAQMHLQQLAPALIGVGRSEEAVALLQDWLEHARAFGAVLPHGTAHMELGRALAGTPAGREHWEEAMRLFDGSPYAWNIAWCRAELGALLRRGNQALQARPLLEQALDYAAREGIEPLIAFAEGELRLTGARPRRRLLSGIDSLTPAEQRIAFLAADGRTNREIAQHLFLTLKTVENNLSRVYRKLDVASRQELPAALGKGQV